MRFTPDKVAGIRVVTMETRVVRDSLVMVEATGRAVVVVEATRMVVVDSDRIMVMKNGKIIESGTADEVIFSPTQAYTKELLNAIPNSKLIY